VVVLKQKRGRPSIKQQTIADCDQQRIFHILHFFRSPRCWCWSSTIYLGR
jgi:hypothetical protein